MHGTGTEISNLFKSAKQLEAQQGFQTARAVLDQCHIMFLIAATSNLWLVFHPIQHKVTKFGTTSSSGNVKNS